MDDWLKDQRMVQKCWKGLLALAIGVAVAVLVWRLVAVACRAAGSGTDLREGLCVVAALACGWATWVVADLYLEERR